jgi:hypothetical protein
MLLDEIVDTLSDSNASLTDALLKTKVLLHQIGKKELVPWVTNELGGYKDFTNLPPYRIVRAFPYASLMSPRWTMNRWRLPIGQLKEDTQKHLSEAYIDGSIDSIEQSVRSWRSKGGKGGLHRPLDPALAGLFAKTLEPGVHIVSIWCEVNMSGVEGILAQVRSRLLDFALELRDVVGMEAGPSDLAQKAATIDTGKIFNTAIYNTSGTVILGSQNFQVNNQRGDIEGLVTEIGKLGYGNAELDELRQAVLADQSKGKVDIAEGETSKWFTKALKEAGKGLVKGGIELASSTIVKAIQAFVGS